jgi:hypothetical protein
MKRIPLILLVLAAMLLSCGMPGVLLSTSTPRPIQTTYPSDGTHPIVPPVCISPKPTQKDIDRALAYTGTVLDSSEWKRSYAVSENRVSVTWQSSSQGAVIYLEALIFPCQYREADLDHYFIDENWKTIFLNYQSHELVDECKTSGGLRLYEFKAVSQGFNYNIHYWVASDSDTRVISTMIVFPSGSEAMLTDYATRLFTDLPSCS